MSFLETRREKIIFGCALASVALISVLGGLVIWNAFLNPCRFLDEQPKLIDFKKLKPVISDDRKSLAKFAGYLEYNPLSDNYSELRKKYMNLDSESLFCINGNNPDRTDVILKSPCAIIELDIKKSDSMNVIENIRLSLTEPSNNKTKCFCKLGAWYPSSSHYLCDRLQVLPCMDEHNKRNLVVTLYLDYLEFEIDGNKSDKFNKPAARACI